jgi:hypothetical protein
VFGVFLLLLIIALVFLLSMAYKVTRTRCMDARGTNPYWGELEHFHNFSRSTLFMLLEASGFHPVHYAVSERYVYAMGCGMRSIRQTGEEQPLSSIEIVTSWLHMASSISLCSLTHSRMSAMSRAWRSLPSARNECFLVILVGLCFCSYFFLHRKQPIILILCSRGR